VKLFDGLTLAALDSFFAYEPAFGLGVFVAAGDVDGDGEASADDQLAIDPSVVPLRPGQTATLENVTPSVRGINGLAIDFVNSPNRGAPITADDFMFMVSTDGQSWAEGPAPTSVVALAGAGPGGADRVLITFADGSITDKWLRVTVEANANTGLAQEQVYYFASVAGETGAAFGGQGQYFGRDAADFRAIVASGLNRPATVGDRLDVDGSGRVDIFDIQSIAVAGIRPRVLPVITPSLAPTGTTLASAAAWAPLPLAAWERPSAESTQRRVKDAAFGQWSGSGHPARLSLPLVTARKAARDLTPADDQTAAERVTLAAFRPSLRDLVFESFPALDDKKLD
jgi:hypothetical protein